MGAWFWVACWFGAGYSLAGGAFGLRAVSQRGRAAWGVALGAAAVFLAVPVIMVWALSGGLPSFGAVSGKVWGFVAGVVTAGALALYRSRNGAREWVGAGGVRRSAAGAAVIVIMVSVGVGLALLVNGGGGQARASAAAESVGVPAVQAVAPKVEYGPVQVEAAGCDCSAGAVCTGPRGGRYCLDGDGKKRYK